MKRLNHLLGICLLLSAILFSSCKEEPVPPVKSDAEIAAEALSKVTWSADKVWWNETDLTTQEMYTNFTLKFTADAEGGTYTTTNGEDAFPASGTWTFGAITSENKYTIIRTEDNVEMTVNVSSSGMTLDFVIPTPSNARTNGTEGPIQFVLVPAN